MGGLGSVATLLQEAHQGLLQTCFPGLCTGPGTQDLLPAARASGSLFFAAAFLRVSGQCWGLQGVTKLFTFWMLQSDIQL